MESDILWMSRALQLAANGRGSVSPNPMVGCVIVHEDRIIGEGWHRQYGGPHAEVWAVNDAEMKGSGHLLAQSTAYVTLEPCSHTGKTPPCADLIIRKEIKKVIICNNDPNPLVSGRGIARMQAAGIEVESGLLAAEGLSLNKRFFTAMEQKRLYVILKWAETADGFLGPETGSALQISGTLSSMRVHKWRTEEDAILVGYKTALTDNPRLNVRSWAGKNPVRVVLDRHLRLPETLNLFDKTQPTVVVNYHKANALPVSPERYAEPGDVAYLKVTPGDDEIDQLLQALLARGIQSVFVEGGAAVINAFLQRGLWDEIRRCQGAVVLGSGVKAPLAQGVLRSSEQIEKDLWTYYSRI
ncbi:bifunctional diaminohydroxyphosphoribosylaminopyrimidine deaminase/5-amino-6-(5-phosphoribosylamino)uracil reductase RibD [Dyadobacter sp. CY326]|uniref:bifunctional diaminohydroxyphosphoribosylaminopyrimidine deaminase/5-amino-6-(5-phosphoribosylamino)uracil reductase RibD n=1 Tax=Dyadobacter sp. CY326 TaxID=2907300 RepID=UPI001F01B01E|nr:bifunctional diaminohydroxyphosphoribosylaminopyrimidine deaminase/5-amino-6-(5-phosphoribosylamino)uracil reductase RibD [Dyadobacter sp. CY326]MCE7067783.1 bifunctional diaminohydroxyphosphoribosylaminopyrimidine deaminase/5-amino-6-(5-phosphoribosylamino)uracil reductase RibD [Dyadobacter sp. CY326]